MAIISLRSYSKIHLRTSPRPSKQWLYILSFQCIPVTPHKHQHPIFVLLSPCIMLSCHSCLTVHSLSPYFFSLPCSISLSDLFCCFHKGSWKPKKSKRQKWQEHVIPYKFTVGMTSFILKPAGAHTQGLKLLEAQDNRIRRDTTDTLWLNVNVYTSSVAITPSAHHSTSATKLMHHCHQKGHLIHHHTVHRVIHGSAQKTRTWVPLNAPHTFTLCSRSCRQWWVQLFSSWKQERSVLSLSKKCNDMRIISGHIEANKFQITVCDY